MRPEHIPPNFSDIRSANVLGNTVNYCIDTSHVEGKAVQITQNPGGVALKVTECEFMAIAEFVRHPKLDIGLHDPKRWHVGFVQNLTQGAIIYQYANGAGLNVYASIAPETVPCKDSGSAGTWYDPSPFSVKQFGLPDEFGADVPLPPSHPARTDINTRYVKMGDAPGTGGLPLRLTCKATTDVRAALNNQYNIGWTDPLNTNPLDPALARLTRIAGSLSFRTCLTVSSEGNPRLIKTTTLFIYLYYVDWEVGYQINVANGVATRGAFSTARLVAQGVWHDDMAEPIVAAPDANESVCVKFI